MTRIKKKSKTYELAFLFQTANVIAITLAFLFIFFTNASAQGVSIIKGHVADERGANVAGAEVRLRSRSGMKLFARTDETGSYVFTKLDPDIYLLEIKAIGFAVVATEELRVESGQTVTRDFRLAVASINETVVVVAAGTPQRVDEVSKSVTLLDEQDIEARRELLLTETLRGTPGLRVQQQGSIGALTTLRLRGQRTYDTAILLDGLRVRDSSEINGSAVSFITDLMPAALDRIEILRGSGSSIYGTNAIGGVINLVPKTGTGRSRFEAGFEAGNLALYRERLQGSGGAGGQRFGWSFGLTRLDVRRGVDGNDEYGNTAGGGRVQFNLTPSATISANFYGTISNARVNNSPFSLAGAFNTNELYPRAIEGVTFQTDFNNPDQGRRNRLLVGSVRVAQRINENFSYTVAYQRVSTKRRNYNGALVDPRFAAFTPFGDFEFVSYNNGATDTLDARANFRLGDKNLLTAGFEFERESFFQKNIPSFTAFESNSNKQRTFAFFAQDQIFLLDGRLQISVGARAQSYRISAVDRPEFLGSVNAERSLTGDGSVAYFIRSTATKLRAHVGNGFRAASLFERFGEGVFSNAGLVRFGDPTLRAEQSISADGGFDQRLARDRVIFGATYFYTRLQRVIAFTGFQSDPLGLGRFSGYTNLPGGLSRGVETYLEAVPLRETNLRASYTYTNSDRATSTSGLEREFVIPKQLFSLNLNQRYRALLFNFDLNWMGSYIAPVFENDFPFRSATLRFDGYTKADLFVRYERVVSDRVTMTFFGGAENIFNGRYFENGFRAPGTLGRGGVNFRF